MPVVVDEVVLERAFDERILRRRVVMLMRERAGDQGALRVLVCPLELVAALGVIAIRMRAVMRHKHFMPPPADRVRRRHRIVRDLVPPAVLARRFRLVRDPNKAVTWTARVRQSFAGERGSCPTERIVWLFPSRCTTPNRGSRGGAPTHHGERPARGVKRWCARIWVPAPPPLVRTFVELPQRRCPLCNTMATERRVCVGVPRRNRHAAITGPRVCICERKGVFCSRAVKPDHRNAHSG